MATLFSNNSRIIKAVIEAVSPVPVSVRSVQAKDFPLSADVVVTMGQISKETEFLALGVRAKATVVLPEGAEWLAEKAAKGQIELIAGSDLSRADNNF